MPPTRLTNQDVKELKQNEKNWDAAKMGYRKHQNEGHRELHEIVNPEDEWKHDWNHKPFPWQHHDEVRATAPLPPRAALFH